MDFGCRQLNVSARAILCSKYKNTESKNISSMKADQIRKHKHAVFTDEKCCTAHYNCLVYELIVSSYLITGEYCKIIDNIFIK